MITFFIPLRGEELTVTGKIEPADRSVGIMSEGLGEWEAHHADGTLCDWEFSDAELQTIDSYAANAYYDDMMEG